MKNITCLVATTLFVGGACAMTARADDPISQVPSTSDVLSLQDPDGTPLVISHPKPQTSSSDADAARKNQQDAIANQDWLLRSYEQQLQLKSSRDPGSDSSNLYYRIATNKDLSRLAGVSAIDNPVSSTNDSLKTGSSKDSQGDLSLRPDPLLQLKATPAPTRNIFAPLITPLGAADAAGLHNFYSTLPAAPAPKKSNTDSTDLDMPGKVAAESDPLAKESLTFDSLPDDPNLDKPAHHDASLDGELPNDSNATRIQKLTDAATVAPGTVKTTTTAAAAHINVTPLQLKLDADPPSPKLVSPGLGRRAIADPYTILGR